MATSITNTSVTTDDLTVDTNVLKVDSANNRVGIGTATPTQATLHVAGGGVPARFESTSASTAYVQFGASATTNYGQIAMTGNDMTLRTAYQDRMTINSNGYVTMPQQPIVALQPDTTSNVTTGNGNSKRVGWATVGGRQTLARAGITIGPYSGGDYIANGNNTGRLTFTTGGVYYFDCTIRMENTPGTGNLYVHFNGTTPHRMHVEAWGRYNYAHGRVSRCITAAANDWIEFGVAVPSGTFSGSNDTVNWLTIMKVA